MVARKIVLSFPPALVDKPVIYRLVKDHDLEFNILKATVTPNEAGLLVMELKGEEEQFEQAVSYLQQLGVRVEPLSKDVVWVEERCVHCGVCVPLCPSSAFLVDEQSREIGFDDERCIACEFCVTICPYEAMEVSW